MRVDNRIDNRSESMKWREMKGNKTKVICANSLEKNWGLGEVAWETVFRVWKRMSHLRTDRHTCEVSAIILWKKELAILSCGICVCVLYLPFN